MAEPNSAVSKGGQPYSIQPYEFISILNLAKNPSSEQPTVSPTQMTAFGIAQRAGLVDRLGQTDYKRQVECLSSELGNKEGELSGLSSSVDSCYRELNHAREAKEGVDKQWFHFQAKKLAKGVFDNAKEAYDSKKKKYDSLEESVTQLRREKTVLESYHQFGDSYMRLTEGGSAFLAYTKEIELSETSTWDYLKQSAEKKIDAAPYTPPATIGYGKPHHIKEVLKKTAAAKHRIQEKETFNGLLKKIQAAIEEESVHKTTNPHPPEHSMVE